MLLPLKTLEMGKVNGIGIMKPDNGTKPDTDKQKHNIGLCCIHFLHGCHSTIFLG
jgi:hypothetical protein